MSVSKTLIAAAATRRISCVLVSLLIFLTTATVALICFRPIGSPDFWWQLAEGRETLATQRVNNRPLAAFGSPASPFSNEYVVYEVLIALFHNAIGLSGLRILFGMVNILPFLLVAGVWINYRQTFQLSHWFCLVLAVALLFVRLRQRPEIVGSALFVSLGLMLLLRGFPTYVSWFHCFIVGLILCLWSNFHSSFIIGLGIVGLWAFETVWRNRAGQDLKRTGLSALCFVAIALAGAIINPAGLNRLWAPLFLQTNFWSIAITDEMWPLPLHWYWVMAMIIFFGSYLWFYSRSEQRPFWLLAALFATALLALASQRHVNLLGCVMLLLLAFRLISDPEPVESGPENILLLASRMIFPLASVAVLLVVLFLLARNESKNWQRGEWAISNQHYAPDALEDLHSRELQGTPFLAGIMVSAYAQGKPEYQLRPLMDTGLSRFSDDTAKFFFYLDRQPPALRLALSYLKTPYVIVNDQNAHWAAVLNSIPDWSVVFVSANGLLYRRHDGAVRNLTALKESIRKVVQELQQEKKITTASFYTMGLLAPEETINLLRIAEPTWWHEPSINFVLDWLNNVPVITLNEAMTRLSTKDPSQLRLRLILALRLGLLDEAKALSRSSKLSARDLEDAVLQAEVLFSAANPCVSREILSSIFPRRRWSVRLAETVNRMKVLCRVTPDEAFVSPKIGELVWSKELELWMRNMSDQLNQGILTKRQLATGLR
jgi:hypothetical protein